MIRVRRIRNWWGQWVERSVQAVTKIKELDGRVGTGGGPAETERLSVWTREHANADVPPGTTKGPMGDSKRGGRKK